MIINQLRDIYVILCLIYSELVREQEIIRFRIEDKKDRKLEWTK